MNNMIDKKYNKVIKIAEGVYWIGYNTDDIFRTNPYLIVDDDEAVLIDPGSQFDFFQVRSKVANIISPSKIKHIILHHQDPDLCGSVRQFEITIGHDIKIYNPERSSFFVKFYDLKMPITKIKKDNEELKLENGRVLKFYMTPYCHAPGSMITYDEKTKIIFTSDIFGTFSKKWNLYADEFKKDEYIESMKSFMEPYMGSKEAILRVADKLDALDIKMICPQHGSIIRKDISQWINVLRKMDYGKALKEEVKWW